MTTGQPTPDSSLIATVALLLSASVSAGGATAHGPDPALSGGPFGQNQVLRFHWRAGSEPPVVIKTAIKAAANDANDTRASKAATFDLRRQRPVIDRLRSGCHVRRQRPGVLHAGRPRRLHDVVPRTGPRLRLGDDEMVRGVRQPTERVLRRRERRPRRIRSCRRPRPSRQLRQRLGLRRRGRPDLLADQAVQRATTGTSSGAATSRGSRSCTTCSSTAAKVLDLSRPVDGPDDRGLADPDRGRRLDDAGRDAQGRRCRCLWTARRQPGPGRTVTLQRRAAGTTTWIAVGTMPAGSVPERMCSPSGPAGRPSTERSSRRRRARASTVTARPPSASMSSVVPRSPDASRLGDPGPMRLIMKGVGCDVRAGPSGGRRSRSLAVALLVSACATARVRPASVGPDRGRPLHPRSRRPRRPGSPSPRDRVAAAHRATGRDAGGRRRRPGHWSARHVHLGRRRLGQPVAAWRADHRRHR